MNAEQLAKELLASDMDAEQQNAILDAIKTSVAQAKEVRQKKLGENARFVVQALKKIETDIRTRYDDVGNKIEQRVASIKDGKDGKDGKNGKDGRNGKDGLNGKDGQQGPSGLPGRDGQDGVDGVSVTDARIDFDGSLIIALSSGREINVGEVVSPDLADSIKVITNGGGTSQVVLDTLASLQTQINNLIPSQSGNSGKFLTTNGSALSWASVAGGLSYQGTWNASTNTPTLTSGVGTNGYYYVVGTAGSTNLNGITDWQVGDWLLYNGSTWQKLDQTNLVTSVNSKTGDVVLSTTDVSEGTQLYYTNARARSSVSAGTGISYNSTTGVISNTITQYTDANARAVISAGTGISYNSTTGVVTNSSPDQTVALTAGTGISTTGTYPNFTITNTSPDRTVTLTGAGSTSISGTYPNFTITSNDTYTGTVTGVTGTAPITSSGGTAPAIGLASGYGDTQNPYASKTANYVLAAPNGAAGAPTFRAIVAADIPTLNQNTTGTAANVTGIVAVGNGGTGQTTANSAFNALAPSQTGNAGKYLLTDGTNTSWATVNSGATISNDTATTTNLYPLFSNATTGAPTTIYTSNAKYLYKPSTGELQASAHVSTNGIHVNSSTVSTSYTISAGSNGFSVGPMTVASGAQVTVAPGQRWAII